MRLSKQYFILLKKNTNNIILNKSKVLQTTDGENKRMSSYESKRTPNLLGTLWFLKLFWKKYAKTAEGLWTSEKPYFSE